MTDATTLSYLNLFAILGALGPLCDLDPHAAALIADKKIDIGISVKNGPCGTLHLDHGKITLTEGRGKCHIKLSFSSPAKLNGMMDGTITPIPSKGLSKINFLKGPFTQLTDMLTKYLRPTPKDLENDAFFKTSTKLMLHVIAGAIVQIANHETIGHASASYIVDGTIRLSVKDEITVAIQVKDHHLTVLDIAPDLVNCMSYMEFSDLHVARELFDGKRNAVVSVGEGLIRVGGMISQVDNINRILDRVALYLS